MKPILIAVACLASLAACGESENDYNSRTGNRNRSGTGMRDTDPSFPGRDANNTGINTRDRDGVLPTPGDQASEKADLANVTAIRKRLMDTELSTDAKNVKVVATGGRVTLRGPVRSAAEKDMVAQIARDVAGATNVDDLLDVVLAK